MLKLLAVSAILSLVTPALSSADWESRGLKDGIALYSQEVPGSDIVALRGVGTVDAPLWKLAAILLDPPRAPEWVDSLAVSTVMKRLSPTSYVEFNHVAMPFIISDRDLVSVVDIELDPKKKTFTLRYSPSDLEAPPSNHVRGKVLSARMFLTYLEKDKTALDAELHCDPMGSLPKWLVNFFQSGWAHETFLGLRRQAAKPDISIPKEFQNVIGTALNY